jgi:hypothetical protein
MPWSKECQEYHLTPQGWVEGSFKGDAIGGSKKVEIPPDRVLTIGCYDVLPHPSDKPHSYDSVLWESDNKALVKELKDKFGERPGQNCK